MKVESHSVTEFEYEGRPQGFFPMKEAKLSLFNVIKRAQLFGLL